MKLAPGCPQRDRLYGSPQDWRLPPSRICSDILILVSLAKFILLPFNLDSSLKKCLRLPLIVYTVLRASDVRCLWKKLALQQSTWQPTPFFPICFRSVSHGGHVVKKNRCSLHCLEFGNSHGPRDCRWPDVINILLIRSVKSNIWIVWYCRE